MADSPRSDDRFLGPRPEPPRRPSLYGQRLDRYLATLFGAGDDAEQRQRNALSALREDPAEAIIAIAKATNCCDRSNYPRRWALIYAAVKMEHPASLPLFRELLHTPIPDDRKRLSHRHSIAREETILRTTAIDGVEALAGGGNKRAVELLDECLDIPSISVRRAAIQATLAVSPKGRRKLERRLPESLRYLLDVKRVAVADVRQIKDPTAHLRNRDAEHMEPAPVLVEDGPRVRPQPTPRTRG